MTQLTAAGCIALRSQIVTLKRLPMDCLGAGPLRRLERGTSFVAKLKTPVRVEGITRAILVLRGQRVILDRELAAIYGVSTGRLNQAVRRNAERFPEDFMFQLTAAELENLRSQFAISSWGGRRYRPFAFTEHGAINVRNSPRAITMGVHVVPSYGCGTSLPRTRTSRTSSWRWNDRSWPWT